ncbi:YkoP family protein [Tumebacillus lipolyticus]|uniref:YkoP-like domain-containing protein n=1 Tax=Tumebacillus lipolyticus TaxID=1280370 RepID=A0ABW4ZSS0_9BACL
MNRIELLLWGWGDVLYRLLRRFDFEDRRGKNIFRIRVRHYAGPVIRLPDGQEIHEGDWVGFLHIYNLRLQQMLHGVKSDNRRGVIVLRETQRSLPELVEFLRRHPRGERIKALIGVTLLNRGVEPLGFTVQSVPDTGWFRFKAWYMRLMLLICHPEGRRLSRKREKAFALKRVMISVEELVRRYGKVQPSVVIDIDRR